MRAHISVAWRARIAVVAFALLLTAGCEIIAGQTELGPEIEVLALKRGDKELAWRLTEPMALNGNYEAQARLAVMYAQGIHVAKDPEEAMYWAELSKRGQFFLAPNIWKEIARVLPQTQVDAAMKRADRFKVTAVPSGYWEWREKVIKGEAGARDAPWLLALQTPASAAPAPAAAENGEEAQPAPTEASASAGPPAEAATKEQGAPVLPNGRGEAPAAAPDAAAQAVSSAQSPSNAGETSAQARPGPIPRAPDEPVPVAPISVEPATAGAIPAEDGEETGRWWNRPR